jgi:hypothetical protein
MARGGPRNGIQGQAYANRTDLMQKPRQPQPLPAPAQPSAPEQGAGPVQMPMPFNAPSLRPNEPVTAGVGMGPGPGPIEAGMTPVGPRDLVLEQLKAFYAAHPNPDLGDLIEGMMAGDYASGGIRGRSLL